MCNYKMEIRGTMALSDYSNIYDYISLVESKDDFTIIIYNSDDENIKMVCAMLRDKNFSIKCKTCSETGFFKIKAFKNS